MKTITLADLQKQLDSIELEGPLLVENNGIPIYVLRTIDDYRDMENSLAILKLMNLSEKSLKNHRLSLDEAFQLT